MKKEYNIQDYYRRNTERNLLVLFGDWVRRKLGSKKRTDN